jgi:site-specific DNA recombinase
MQMQIKAAAYYRMSSDDQKTSIAQQRHEVRVYAKEQGYEIVREYVDEGTSGSKDQHKRIEFAKMLTDAANHDFLAVLCWNTSRFARLDSFDAVMAKQALRTHGIHLNTVKEGKIDWNSFEGRILDMLRSESDHKFSRDISASTLRGRHDALERGFWPNGAVPYGYDRLYVDGEKSHLIKRNESFRKPRTWQLKLVINDAEAKIVRWLFQEFCCREKSRRQLAIELSKRSVPSPGNSPGGWTKDSVKAVLCNRAYIGIGHIGLGRRRAKEAFNRAVPTEKADCCPAIVDPAMYDAAQKRLSCRRDAGRKPHSSRSSALSGCLVCGHCGYRMDKKERKGRVYFTCSSAMRRPQLGCSQWRVHEDEILPAMVQVLVKAVDFEMLKTIQSQPIQQADVGLELLEHRADMLRRDIERGNERYLKAPSDILAGLEEKLLGWKKELTAIEDQIRQSELAKNQSAKEIFFKWWDRVRGQLTVVSEIEWGNPKTERRPIHLCGQDRKAIEKHIGGKVGSCLASWTGNPDAGFEIVLGKGNLIELDSDGNAWELVDVEFPVKPAVMAERDSLSALLHDLKVRITLFWKPGTGRYFELDRRRLQAEINGNFLGARTAMRAPATKRWG